MDERAANPCIGKDRADLVVLGGAILDAVLRVWPAPRIRVADRGLREGVLMRLIAAARRDAHERRAARRTQAPLAQQSDRRAVD